MLNPPLSLRQCMPMVTVMGAALVVACGGGSGGANVPVAQVVPPVVALSASSSGALLDYVKAKIKQAAEEGRSPQESVGFVSTTAVAASAAPAAASATAFAGTQLQEAGVDEDDVVKTDGTMLYVLSSAYALANVQVPAQLQAQRRQANGQLTPAGTLALDASNARTGMFLASAVQRLAVVGQRQYMYAVVPAANAAQTTVNMASPSATSLPLSVTQYPKFSLDLVSLSVPGVLSLANRVQIDGQLIGSRMIGNTLYLASTWTPNLSTYAFTTATPASQVDAKLATLRSTDILPTLQIDDKPAVPLVSDTDCYLQAKNASARVQVTTITAFDLSSPSLQRSSRCFIGESQALYMSPANVYLTSSRYYSYASSAAAMVFPSGSATDVHKFALKGLQMDYRGSGVVPGHLGWDSEKMPYRMSEHQGVLRVLSFTGATGWIVPATTTTIAPMPSVSASPATLTLLRESSTGTSLDVVGSLPNARRPAALGHAGEQVYGVQFAGARAYVVTFRRTDPLYVLDVADPADPKAMGELEMPGYSDYLYPLGDKLLLGVGKDASQTGFVEGVKVALMDVADPAQPKLLNALTLGSRGSLSALDFSRHGINIFQRGALYRVGLPVRVAGVSQYSQGLQRFEVDSTAKTLVSKPQVSSLVIPFQDPNNLAYGQYSLSQERSVQIDDMVYYFTGGKFLSSGW